MAQSVLDDASKCNYFRVCSLVIDTGRRVLSELFHKEFPVDTLAADLANHHDFLQTLEQKRIITKSQWNIIFPPIGDPNPDNFDISLLSCLLRNICQSIESPRNGWDKNSPPSETTQGADISRIRQLRNKIMGHASKARLDSTAFNHIWKRAKDSMVRLASSISTSFKEEIEKEISDVEKEPFNATKFMEHMLMVIHWVSLDFNTRAIEIETNYQEAKDTFAESQMKTEAKMEEKLAELREFILSLKDEGRRQNLSEETLNDIPRRMSRLIHRKSPVQTEDEEIQDEVFCRQTSTFSDWKRTFWIQKCQRRLEHLVVEGLQKIPDVNVQMWYYWMKGQMWCLELQPYMVRVYDVLYSVGKSCELLEDLLKLPKKRFLDGSLILSYIKMSQEVTEIVAICRDIIIRNPSEVSSVQNKIECLWRGCTPFLAVFARDHSSVIPIEQLEQFLLCTFDLISSLIQVGRVMYQEGYTNRGAVQFSGMCTRLYSAFHQESNLLCEALKHHPQILESIRGWVQYGTNGEIDPDRDVRGTLCVSPVKLFHDSSVLISCTPDQWWDIRGVHFTSCPKEKRKEALEEISLKENQELASDIYISSGLGMTHHRGFTLHCPLSKYTASQKTCYFVKIKKGENWIKVGAIAEELLDKGVFLSFPMDDMESFVAIEELPLISKEVGSDGGKFVSDVESKLQVNIPSKAVKETTRVDMMIRPSEKSMGNRHFEDCHVIKALSDAVELTGLPARSGKDIMVQIPYTYLKTPGTKLLLLHYGNSGSDVEIKDPAAIARMDGDCYSFPSSEGGNVLAAVDQQALQDKRSKEELEHETQVLLGKNNLCKFIIFEEFPTSPSSNYKHVFTIVLTEKHRIDKVVEEKTTQGLKEIPFSRSRDLFVRPSAEITLDVKGDVLLPRIFPKDALRLTYLDGADNFIRVPVTKASASASVSFSLRLDSDTENLYSFFHEIEEVVEDPKSPDTPSEERSPPPPYPSVARGGQREFKIDEEERSKAASLMILDHKSLKCLTQQLQKLEMVALGTALGIEHRLVSRYLDSRNHMLAGHQLLIQWRGKRPVHSMADKLVETLRGIGKSDVADVICRVRQQCRSLIATDFNLS